MKTEKELIDASFLHFKIRKGHGKFLLHEKVHCRTQVEIDGCIADGLIFIEEQYRYSRIIGLEAKTNKDNYLRLYNQVNSYLAICDEVYLVIEDKVPPSDLPFYVGIIEVGDEVQIKRFATNLKHSINAHELWITLLKAFTEHCHVQKGKNALDFFNTVENIKRKLVWNQFVIGFHQTYVKEYIPLTEVEKRIVRVFFGEFRQIGLCDIPTSDTNRGDL